MRALVYTGVEAMEMRDWEDPVPVEGQALINVAHCGLCGSDMHAYQGHDDRRPAPLILGHEAAGTIAEGDPEAGRRVCVNPLVECGECEQCLNDNRHICPNRKLISMAPRQGAFAEKLAMRRENLVTVPESVPLQHAALTEPLACAWHCADVGIAPLRVPLDQAQCLVIGGGAIGFGSALALALKGARHITISEPNAKRRAKLAQHCDFTLVDPSATPLAESAYHLVIDAVGFAGTRAEACHAVKPGGAISHIGLGAGPNSLEGGVDIRKLTLFEITLAGSYCYSPQDFRDTAQAIFDGRFGPLDWIEERPLEEGKSCFDAVLSGAAVTPKFVLGV